mmetsp:Transcript_55850/g.81649  ORF Transcript_55850/g.81649 Transcript_55850/m.81649 type:complete len:110 (-) Transcript_55850:138-467(-)
MRNKTDIKAVEARCDDGGYIIKETGRHHHATTIAPHAFLAWFCTAFSLNQLMTGWQRGGSPLPPPSSHNFLLLAEGERRLLTGPPLCRPKTSRSICSTHHHHATTMYRP